jgi:hypothetical protein
MALTIGAPNRDLSIFTTLQPNAPGLVLEDRVRVLCLLLSLAHSFM